MKAVDDPSDGSLLSPPFMYRKSPTAIAVSHELVDGSRLARHTGEPEPLGDITREELRLRAGHVRGEAEGEKGNQHDVKDEEASTTQRCEEESWTLVRLYILGMVEA